MAKTKKSNLKKLLLLCAGLLGIVSVCLMAAAGITATSKITGTSVSNSGFELMFGTLGDGYEFNFMMFLALVLSVVGIAGAVLSFFTKGNLGALIATIAFLIAGVFYFLFRTVYPMCFGENGDTIVEAMELVSDVKLGAGAIVAGVLSLVSFLLSAGAVIIKK